MEPATKRAFDVRIAFGQLNLHEFLVPLKGEELHVADSALGQGDGLDELSRSLLALFSWISLSRGSFAELEPVLAAEQRVPCDGIFSCLGSLVQESAVLG